LSAREADLQEIEYQKKANKKVAQEILAAVINALDSGRSGRV
jgi:hypothetical protein